MNKLNTKGFSAVEALLILAVIGLIGGLGWYIFEKNKSTSGINGQNTLNNNPSRITGPSLGKQSIDTLRNNGVVLFAPKNYNGPIQLKYFDTESSQSYILMYVFNGSHPTPPVGDDLISMSIFKKPTSFQPTTDCGPSAPITSAKPDYGKYPCEEFIKTPRGRQVYSYVHYVPDKYTDAPALTEIMKNQPERFYALIDNMLIVVSNTSSSEFNKSPLTSEMLGQFIDSLEPTTGADLTQFTKQFYITNITKN